MVVDSVYRRGKKRSLPIGTTNKCQGQGQVLGTSFVLRILMTNDDDDDDDDDGDDEMQMND